jgi:membrane dipeptidase
VHWLGDVSSASEAEAGVERLFNAGFRQLALTHQFDNGLAGASEGCVRFGLTPLGRIVLAKAERLCMVVDLAHLSSAAIKDAVDMLSAPVVVSHGGVQNSCVEPLCHKSRNLTDADIEAVGKNGGVIGIGYWPAAVGKGLPSVVNAIAYTVSVLSRPDYVAARKRENPVYDPYDHIALGSDFDGVVEAAIDSSQLALLTGALRRFNDPSGVVFTEERIRKIAGGNVCRVYAARLPGSNVRSPGEICRGTVRANMAVNPSNDRNRD